MLIKVRLVSECVVNMVWVWVLVSEEEGENGEMMRKGELCD